MKHSRKHAVLALALLIGSALAIVGCSSDELAHLLGSGLISFTPKFAVAANFSDTTLSVYGVNATTGVLTEVANSPFDTVAGGPWGVVVNQRLGNVFYVASDNGTGVIEAFSVNNTTGALTSLGSVTAGVLTSRVTSIAVTLTGYTINTTSGAITPIATGFPIALTNPIQITSNPQLTQLFVSEETDPANIDSFTINATTGQLTAAAGSPFQQGDAGDGLAVDPSGKFVYGANCSSGDIAAATIGTNAALTTIPGAPFPAGACSASVAVTH